MSSSSRIASVAVAAVDTALDADNAAFVDDDDNVADVVVVVVDEVDEVVDDDVVVVDVDVEGGIVVEVDVGELW